jgi:hypothetical protein
MGYRKDIAQALCATALLCAGGPLQSAQPQREPLVVTELSDPEPVPPVSPRPKLTLTRLAGADQGELAVDRAIEDLGRALNDALAAQQQATEARCRSGQPEGSSSVDRFDWAAHCRYRRH